MTGYLYFTYDWSPDHKAYVGVITDRPPRTPDGQLTPGVNILAVEKKPSVDEIRRWFAEQSKTQPWKTRQ